MSEQTNKSLRTARRNARYQLQFARTETNRKRRMGKHIRSQPNDAQAVKTYEKAKNFGPATLGLNSHGRHRAARAAFLATLKTRDGLFRAMAGGAP